MEILRESCLTWPGIRSEHAWIRPHDGETRTGAGQVGIAFSAHRDVAWSTGGVTHRSSYPGGSAVVTGAEPVTWSRVREPTEALEIYLEPALLRETAAVAGSAPFEPRAAAQVGLRDPVVLGAATVLRREHLAGDTIDDVRAGELAHLLARHVLDTYHQVPVEPLGRPTRLDATTLARVHDLVEAELAGRLTIERLAEVAHLSPFHFARAFRATTGMPPHAYVTARRLDRARAMLTGTALPVSDVAEASGFGNLSHFRRTFRAQHGLGPGELRRLAG